MIAEVLTYIAVAVALFALVLNFLAWRKKPRRKWLYFLGMLAAPRPSGVRSPFPWTAVIVSPMVAAVALPE